MLLYQVHRYDNRGHHHIDVFESYEAALSYAQRFNSKENIVEIEAKVILWRN